MDRNGIAYNLAAVLAGALVPRNSSGAALQPSFATVGRNTSYPLRRVFSGLLPFHVRGMTAFATKAKAGFAFVLALNPGLNFERFAAFRACVGLALYMVHSLRLLASERICRTQSRTPLVPDFVIAWHGAVSHVPFATALLAAEPRGLSAIRLHFERCFANFACLIDHAFILTGTTGIAKQGQLFEPEPPKQVQESLV